MLWVSHVQEGLPYVDNVNGVKRFVFVTVFLNVEVWVFGCVILVDYHLAVAGLIRLVLVSCLSTHI